MNMLECRLTEDGVLIGDQHLQLAGGHLATAPSKKRFTLGVRPEYVALSSDAEEGALPARLLDVKSVGTFRIATLDLGGQRVRAKVAAEVEIPGGSAFVRFAPDRCLLYADDQLIRREGSRQA